jgi:hypothetical protein
MLVVRSPNPRVECSPGQRDKCLRLHDERLMAVLCDGTKDVLSVIVQVSLLFIPEAPYVSVSV